MSRNGFSAEGNEAAEAGPRVVPRGLSSLAALEAPSITGTWLPSKAHIKELEPHCVLLEQGLANYSPQTKCRAWFSMSYKVFLERATSFIYVSSMAPLLQRQSWAAVTETEPKIRTNWSFTENSVPATVLNLHWVKSIRELLQGFSCFLLYD